MKALTVQQPWAWAIIHGGKDVENRTTKWKYCGPLLIHAGLRLSERGCMTIPDLIDGNQAAMDAYTVPELVYGAIIGVVDLVNVHWARPGCCESPWAEQSYTEHGGRERRAITHLVLENPRPIDPVHCTGALSLWTPPSEVLQQIEVTRG